MEYFFISIIAFTLSSIICFIFYSFIVTFPLEFRYEERPLLFLVYLKAFWLSFKRKQTSKIQHLFSENGKRLSKESRFTVIARDCRIDQNSLQFYAKLCGYTGEIHIIPPCYLENYFVTLVTVLITSDQFLLSPLGLIYLSQSITQHTCLEHLMKEPFDVECALTEYRGTARGVEVELVMRVYDRREMCVWESTCILLSQNAETLKKARDLTPCSDIEEEDETRKNERLTIELPANLGRQFAWASGDWNPHHLWASTAKLLHYSQPSAHGMWMLARCLSHLQISGLFALIPPFHVTASFKRPAFLPGSSTLTFMRQTDKNLMCFRVEDTASAAPQLIGRVHRK